ncbi:heavy metal translocating P-type ATPase [Melghiribacillus thermohalophilus]|nr:heavy metal translocating P-type ATPase [Melghiribacillus thermohalophilus]
MELIAALTSGAIILFAFLTEGHLSSTWTAALYISAYVIGGLAKAKEGIEDTIKNKDLNVELLMIIAAIGAASIGHWWEGAVLIFIFSLSGALETYTMNKSHKEISALMDMQPDTALRIVNGQTEEVHVSELKVGDQFFVRAGERIPADGNIVRGSTSIDEAAITGESMPEEKSAGDEVFAGTLNLNGSITVELTKPSEESVFQKIIELVHNAKSEKSPSQLFIERFEGIYVNIVLTAGVLLLFVPHYLFDWSWETTFYRAMIFLVVASPCALVASIMPATLSAISNGARNGILFKGGVHVENLGQIKAIALDKTGTLTKGTPEVTDVYIREGLDVHEIFNIIGSIEKQSTHPLAKAIVRYVKSQKIEPDLTVDNMQDVTGKGVTAQIGSETWKIGKPEFIGNQEVESFQNGISRSLADQGKTLVIAADENGIAAMLALKDVVREDAKEALGKLKRAGIRTIMITGDNDRTAQAIARECGIDEYYTNCLPEDKVDHIRNLKEAYGQVAMTGDGINDAPALATANLGIAMGEGTDVALETADIVLMKNDLSKIADAISLSKRMSRIIKQNVIFSIAVIILLLISNFAQTLNMPLGVIGHEGSTILVILNGLRLLK